jgi:hypothetical protein
MDVFVFVIIVVFIGCASGVANTYMKNQRELRQQQRPSDAAMAELDELRGRIETLEKIVTDEKYQLSRELTALERQS